MMMILLLCGYGMVVFSFVARLQKKYVFISLVDAYVKWHWWHAGVHDLRVSRLLNKENFLILFVIISQLFISLRFTLKHGRVILALEVIAGSCGNTAPIPFSCKELL